MSLVFRALALLSLLTFLAPPAAAEDPWFTVDPLNEGLGAPPESVDRRTPRTALDSFLGLAESGDFNGAAHLLDLGDYVDADQAREGNLLARQLHSVMQRKAVLNWARLNQRPDGLQILGGSQQAQAGEPRRSLLIRELDLEPVPSAIRLNRVKPGEDADPVWVFPRETVADIPALYREYGPSRLEARLPPVLLQEAIGSVMWWELIGLPLLLAAAILSGWLIHRALRGISQRVGSRGRARHPGRASDPRHHRPRSRRLVTIASRSIFVFSGQIEVFLSPLIAVGYVTAILVLILNTADAILDNLLAPGADTDLTRSEHQEARSMATKLNAVKRILTIAVVLIGAGVVLSTADVFRGLGLSLLASAGALTLVFGFAAREMLSNIMASLQIALNQSARMGDRVVWKGELCYVERIHLTFVQLRNWDDTRIIVPVGEFVTETFTNWSIQDLPMLKILKFKFRPEADLDALRSAFERIMKDLSNDEELSAEVGSLEDAAMNVTGQDVFGIDVWFSVPCSDPNTSWDVACETRERIVKEARELRATDGQSIFPEAQAAEAA